MPFFQNTFDVDYSRRFPLGDRHVTELYKVSPNRNSSQAMMAYVQEPWNLTGNTNLTFNFSLDGIYYTAVTVNVTTAAASITSVKSFEVATALNSHAQWSAWFEAEVTKDKAGGNWLRCRSRRSRENWKVYISNGSAESIMRFNRYAGVAELPTICSIDTIDNASDSRSVGMLIELNTGNASDQAIITDAGLDYTVEQEDWQLLGGRSGFFTFSKVTTDAANGNRPTEILEYSAGAREGDYAKKTIMEYNVGNTTGQANRIFEIPYTLQTSDLITP